MFRNRGFTATYQPKQLCSKTKKPWDSVSLLAALRNLSDCIFILVNIK